MITWDVSSMLIVDYEIACTKRALRVIGQCPCFDQDIQTPNLSSSKNWENKRS